MFSLLDSSAIRASCLKPGKRTWPRNAHLFVALALTCATFLAAPRPVFAQGSVTATIDPANPNNVPAGQPTTFALNATATPPDDGYNGVATWGAPTWSWYATGVPDLVPDVPDPSSSAATLVATLNSPGFYTLTVTATATWTGSDGTTVSANDFTSVTFAVVAVDALWYSQPNAGFVNVPATLYVLVGQSVTFQAIRTSADSLFPPGNPVWSGSSGASGTGDTITVTFATLSATATAADFQTVTATCGNTSVTANVIVFDLLPTMTPQDNFAGRDLDYYGVCELIDLTFSTVPSGISQYNIGGLQWQIDSGAGVLTDNGDGTGIYKCAAVADTVTLSLGITGGPMLAQKKLPPPKGIIPPTAHAMAQTPNTGLWHKNTYQSCFVNLDFWAKGPKNTSYKRIEVQEGESTKCVADGIFADDNDKVHTPSGGWFDLDALVPLKGYKWQTEDECGYENPGDYGDGNRSWKIFMQYREALVPGVANADKGQWYADCLSKREGQQENGVMIVWKDPVGPFTRQEDDVDHQNYNPEP
jgi:plastocyanin